MIHCYTDGSCKAGEGAPGGWGFVLKEPGGATREGQGSATHTLAKVMEYRAVAEALAVAPLGAALTVFSDNQSLIANLDTQLETWRRRDFAKVDETIVSSLRAIAAAIADKRLTVTWQWVRGHNGNAGNERADALAAEGARAAKAQLAAEAKARAKR